MRSDIGIRPMDGGGPVISGYGRALARHALAEKVAAGPLPWRAFLRQVWVAYGGRRVSVNAYQARLRADQETAARAPLAIPPARMFAMSGIGGDVNWTRHWTVDDWPLFNVVAKEWFARAVHVRRLRRTAENDG